jgi:carbohydrate kinase (thermoresistant glucokinase family)
MLPPVVPLQSPRSPPPRVIVLMGVSGCGKSTTGRYLSRALGWPFRDADTFHPDANIQKMSRGVPLDDEDRMPWLRAIAEWIDGHRTAGTCGIVSCSALKKPYREILIGRRSDVALVYLQGSFALISDRLSRRKGHFMPPELLRSQFAALEEPTREELALRIPVRLPPKRVVERILAAFDLPAARRVPTSGA